MAVNQITVIKEIITLIKKTKKELSGVKRMVVDISKAARQGQGSFGFTIPKQVNEELKQNNDLVTRLNTQLLKQEGINQRLQI